MRDVYVSLLGGFCALVIAIGISRFAYTPILPHMQEALGFSSDDMGFIASINYIGYFLGAMIHGVFKIDKKYNTLLIKIYLLLSFLSIALMSLNSSIVIYSALRFVAGMASGGLLVLASSITLDFLHKHKRDELAGFLYSGVGSGIFLSGILTQYFEDSLSWDNLWIMFSIFTLILSIVVIFAIKEDSQKETHIKTNPHLNKNIKFSLTLLALAYAFEGFGYIISATFLVSIVKSIESLQEFGNYIWMVVGLSAAPSTIIWSYIAKKIGASKSLVYAYFIQIISILILIYFQDLISVVISSILFGGTFMGIVSLSLSFGKLLSSKDSSLIVGILTAGYGIGQIIGPILAGYLADKSGNFTVSLIICVGVLLFSFIFMVRKIR